MWWMTIGTKSDWMRVMYVGIVIFLALAILCVVAYMKVKRRDDEYGRGE